MNYRDVFGSFMETPLYICDAPLNVNLATSGLIVPEHSPLQSSNIDLKRL